MSQPATLTPIGLHTNSASAPVRPGRVVRGVVVGLLALNALVCASSAFLVWRSYVGEVADVQIQTTNVARLVEASVGATLDKAALALQATSASLEREMARSGSNNLDLWNIVDDGTQQVSAVQRIGVFDAAGQQVCAIPAGRCQHIDVSDRVYFQRLREHPNDPIAVYGPYVSRVDGQQVIVLAKAVKVKSGAFAGVAAAVIPLSGLRAAVSRINLGARGAASLLTANLNLLVRVPELAQTASSTNISSPLRAAVAVNPIEGVYRGVSVYDGAERVASYRRLADYPLYVLIGEATDDFLHAWRQMLAWAIGFVILFAAASLVIARATFVAVSRQERAQRLFDEAPCGYHTLDAEGIYLTVNATELAWLGCRRDEVVGRLRAIDFFDEEGRKVFAENFSQFKATGRLDDLEFNLVSRSGAVRRVSINAGAVLDRDGRFVSTNSVMHDITALHESRKRLDALAAEQGVMLNTNMIGIARGTGRVMNWANHGMTELFGYSHDEFQGMPVRRLYPDDASYEQFGRENRAALESGRPARSQIQMVRKDGSLIWVDANGVRLSAATGEVMVMLADITPLKRAEEERMRSVELESQNSNLREADRLKRQFLSNMSHELRTPLNAVNGFSQLLQMGLRDKPKLEGYARHIDASGRHLLQLIDTMLDYSKLLSGEMGFRAEPIDLAAVIGDVVDILEAKREKRQVTVEVDVAPDIGPVEVDPMRLRQVLLNYVGNAVKFSNAGGRVRVRATAEAPTHFRVEVEDHGIGIAPTDIPRLFKEFFQLSAGDTKAYEGTGMGLAVVRRLVEAQRGSVGVRSELGVGSVFHFSLPRSPAPS